MKNPWCFRHIYKGSSQWEEPQQQEMTMTMSKQTSKTGLTQITQSTSIVTSWQTRQCSLLQEGFSHLGSKAYTLVCSLRHFDTSRLLYCTLKDPTEWIWGNQRSQSLYKEDKNMVAKHTCWLYHKVSVLSLIKGKQGLRSQMATKLKSKKRKES